MIRHLQIYLDDSPFEDIRHKVSYLTNTFGNQKSYSFHAYENLNLADENRSVREHWFSIAMQSVDLISSIGGTFVNFHIGFFIPRKENRQTAFETAFSMFHKLCEYALKKRIEIHVENDINTSDGYERLGTSMDDWDAIYRLNEQNLYMCYDIGHANISFGDAFAYRQILPKIHSFHIHNNNSIADSHIPFGDAGAIPLDKAFAELINLESKYLILENNIEGYNGSLAYINEHY